MNFLAVTGDAWKPGNGVASVLAGVLIYLLVHLIGQILKKRTGVRLGLTYEIFAATLAIIAGSLVYEPGHAISVGLKSIAQLTGAFVITAIVNRYFWEIYFIRSGKPAAPKFFSQVFSLIVIVAALVLIVTANFQEGSNLVKTVLTTGGVLALTIGLALQDLLGNIIAGFAIHFGQPFKLGDWLILDNTHVEVMEINWRSTRCRTNDDTYLDVPNASITKQTVMNLYYPDRVHAIRVYVSLEYDTPPNLAKDCLLRAALGAQGVMATPKPVIYLKEFADSSINYEIKAFIMDHSKYPVIMDAIRTNIWYELKRKKLTIPFPQRVLQVNRPVKAAPENFSNEVIEVLRKQDSFSFLTPVQLRRLTEGCQAIFYGRNEKIIQQGEPGESMFVILSGSVSVLVECDAVSTEVAVMKEGACFGEMSLLTGEKRSATVIAVEDSLVVELCKESMSRLLKENVRVVEKLGELLANRKLTNETQLAATKGKGGRVATARSLKASFLSQLKAFFDL
ncbi:MAG: mechanosensitive ion channel family protein [Chthoniobacterales bacterium]